MNNFLELKNIQKNFTTEKTIKVLRGLSKKFKLGKIYAVMGPSGSGKSTLLNLISLIDRPTSGSIKFDNHAINIDRNEANDLFRAKKIGIVYQQNNLLSDFTALENVYLASDSAVLNNMSGRISELFGDIQKQQDIIEYKVYGGQLEYGNYREVKLIDRQEPLADLIKDTI